MASGLQVGDVVPDFSLPSQKGDSFEFSKHKGKKNLVIYFYPKDDTPGCTKESCTFRDYYEDFVDAGAEVIGISSDSIESHQNFAQKHRLPFTLLSDEKGEVRKLFGVPKTMGLLPGRVTYLVDKQGKVKHIFNSQFQAEKHVMEALAQLQK